MFDWNDEELTHIIWGEAGESDDHIVPFYDHIEDKPPVLFGDSTKKETNPQTTNISSVDVKKTIIKSEPVVELDGCPKYGIKKPTTGLGVDSWADGPDPSSSNATKGDPDLMVAATSDNMTKSNKNGSVTDETAQFNKNSGIFENPPEGGEQDDFVDYGWANIGSFDDLDRMFSNSDAIFGDISVRNADELWSSSKDITNSPIVPTPLSGDSSDSLPGSLRATIDHFDMKTPHARDTGLSFASGYDKLNETTSHTPQDAQASIDNIEHSGGKSSILLNEKTLLQSRKAQPDQKQGYARTAAAHANSPEKGNRQKRLPKVHKSVKKIDAKQLLNFTGTWTSSGSPLQQVNNQYAPPLVNPCNPLMLTPQRPLRRIPEPFQQKHFPRAPLGSPLYANVTNQYPAPPVLAQFHPGEGSHGIVPSGYEVPPTSTSSLKNLEDPAVKPPAMTPKEKIEKLRRLQQMRAMLAIQKQQMQFGNQASVSEHSSMEGGKIEIDDSISSLPSLEPNSSPIEQDNSNTMSMAFDNCSVEESVLHQLQDTISKMDLQIRLCIRDSLYRLAQSAMQRQHSSDTNSANSRDETHSNQDLVSHERTPDVETDTNPIDRTVAHLLFHRPLEFTGKFTKAPESPSSANIPYERKASLLAKGYFPESLDNIQIASPQGAKATGLSSSDEDQSRNVPSFITFENTSRIESAEGSQAKAEASK